MAGISKISELEARKHALVTESEICREQFKAELENLGQYSATFFQKFDRARSTGTWLILVGSIAVPLLSFVWRKKSTETSHSPKLKARVATGLLALRLFRKYGPIVKSLFGHFKERRRSASEARWPAATN